MENYIKNIIFVICLLQFLPACNTKTIIPVKPESFSHDTDVIYILNKPDKLLTADYELDHIDASSAAISAQTAHMSAAQSAGSYGGGLAAYLGAILGISLVNTFRENSASFKANNEITNLEKLIHENEIYRDLESGIFKRTPFVKISSESLQTNKLYLSPTFKFTSDLRSIRLYLVVELKNRKNDTVYLNEIEFYASNMPAENQNFPVNYWLENDGLNLKTAISEATEHSIDLFSQDYSGDIRQNDYASKAIKYRNVRGTFYERGYILEYTGHRITFRTLRGGIKSVPGELIDL